MEASTGIDFVKQAMQHDCMADPSVSYLWLWLISNSMDSDTRVAVRNGRALQWLDLQCGQVLVNFTQVSKHFNCTRKTILNRLSKLQDCGLIFCESRTFGSVVSVVNSRTKRIHVISEVAPKSHQSRTKVAPNDFEFEDEFDDTLESISISVSDAVKQQDQPSNLFGDIEQPSKPKTSTKDKKFNARDYPIPDALDTPEFREAWNDFIKHRIEKKKPLTETTCKKNMKWFVEIGVARAAAALDFTTRKGWQGIQEPPPEDARKQKEDDYTMKRLA